MSTTILLPIYALFIGGCSGIIGTFYMRSLPAFPLTAWWWQWGQRFETSHPNLFKMIWSPTCTYCFCGHVGWVSFLIYTAIGFTFNWWLLFIVPYCMILAAGAGYISAIIFNQLYDKK